MEELKEILEKLSSIESKMEIVLNNYIQNLPKAQREKLKEELKVLETREWERRMGDDL